MADITERHRQIVSRWSTALDAIRYAGANAIAIPVADMAVILDAARTGVSADAPTGGED